MERGNDAELLHLEELIETATAEHFEAKETSRDYLGASLAGHACERYIWLNYRRAVTDPKSGTTYRLLDRGHLEEARFCRWLEMVGAVPSFTGKRQKEVACRLHVKGHLDGLVRNLPDDPDLHLLEFKTHNQKSFTTLKNKGLKEAKPQHWVQMQLYMLGLQRTRRTKASKGLYMAVNKNTDELYLERVILDRDEAEKWADRAETIACSDRAPAGLLSSATAFPCKMCAYRFFCYDDSKELLADACPSCAFYDPTEGCMNALTGGKRPCGGNDCYAPHPDVAPWMFRGVDMTTGAARYLIDGQETVIGLNAEQYRTLAGKPQR